MNKPHIMLVIARGEAVRNFVYSDTLRLLSENARVSLLSLIDHGDVVRYIQQYTDKVYLLKQFPENRLVTILRDTLHYAHFRWLWSKASQHHWSFHCHNATTLRDRFRWNWFRFASLFLARRPMLERFTKMEEYLSWLLRPTHDFEALFAQLKPDLVFNCSHIHGPQADLPLRVAHRMRIPTATFIFSWDNLTSRSRIFVPYDYYLMWNEEMRQQLLGQYPFLSPSQVIVTGTPQFDFHFKPEFTLPREELCHKLGLDPERPFILYTTSMAESFPDEHKFVEMVICFMKELEIEPKPQLVVRTYIKSISPEMRQLSNQAIPDVVFPMMLWDKEWVMPLHDDLSLYSSLLHHTSLGINAASTVSLELMMLDKPVINLGFEPPGSNLPHWDRFSRHVDYDHYRPVIESGGVMLARSPEDLRAMIFRGLTQPAEQSRQRLAFIQKMFGNTLDGSSGTRVALTLLELAQKNKR